MNDEALLSRALGGLLCFLLLLPTGAGAADEPKPQGVQATALVTATALVDAFNRHEPLAMAELVTTDFELYYVNDQGVASVGTRGRVQLVDEMIGYFKERPEVRSEIAGAIDGPVFVSFREQIVGGESSLAVYEVRDGLIRRAWYFPAE